MSKVAIVTDSTAYLPPDMLEKHHITALPQILIWGEEHFRDGMDIQPDEFYKRLENSKVMPTTSQVSIMTMKDTFESLLQKGYDVIGIFLSAKLSGTIQSAVQAKDMLPQASAKKVVVIDSLSTAMAMGFQVLTVARAAEGGASLADCEKLANQARDHTGVFFVVDTLEFLRRGGRIGGAQALLGTALNIKPVLELRGGQIESVDKVRTRSKAYERLVELVCEQIGNRTPVRLATLHANAEAEARSVLADATGKVKTIETVMTSVSPVVGAHTGPGTVGLAYMAGM